MQVFGNVATAPERKESKTTGKGYYQFRICEAQRGVDNDPTWYTVRLMKDEDPLLDKGEFIKVTGKLKADFYIGRDGKPSGTLLIIAFEASKIAKPAAMKDDAESGARRGPGAKEGPKQRSLPARQDIQKNDLDSPESVEPDWDWTSMYK